MNIADKLRAIARTQPPGKRINEGKRYTGASTPERIEIQRRADERNMVRIKARAKPPAKGGWR